MNKRLSQLSLNAAGAVAGYILSMTYLGALNPTVALVLMCGVSVWIPAALVQFSRS